MNVLINKSASMLILLTQLAACGPVMYSNIGHNVPLFKEEQTFVGQAFWSESSSLVNRASGLGLQGAYSVSEKFAVISSVYTMKGPSQSSDDTWRGKGSYFELGGGYFKNSSNRKLVYEGYVGLGMGGIKNKSLDTPRDYVDARFLKPFFQPNLAYATRYFDVAISPRLAYVAYTSVGNFHLDSPDSRVNIRDYYHKNNNRLVFEPGITFRGGFPNAKLELQYSFSTLTDPLVDTSLVNNRYFSIGLWFQLAGRSDTGSLP